MSNHIRNKPHEVSFDEESESISISRSLSRSLSNSNFDEMEMMVIDIAFGPNKHDEIMVHYGDDPEVLGRVITIYVFCIKH
jgi:hypothetical protein